MKKNKLMSKVSSFVSMLTMVLSVLGFNALTAQAAVATAPNPTLGQSCGIKVVLILDSSDSMSDADITTVKNDANALVGSLMPANPIGVIDFDTQVVNSLPPATDITTVTNAINSIGHTNATESTNWDAALNKASTMVGSGDLVVIITDGNPTTHDGSGNDIDNAVTRANTIKNMGARVLAIGINSSGTQGGLNLGNLELISGTQVANGTFTNINTADVYLGDISTLGSVLANLTTALCGGQLTVSKQLYMGEGVATIPGGAGWQFVVNGNTYPTDNNSSISVPFNKDTNGITVSEVTQTNFPFRSVSCANGTQTGDQPEVTGISITKKTTVNCTFVNTQPDMCPGDLDPGVQTSSANCTVPPTLCTDPTANNVGYPIPCTFTKCAYNPDILASSSACVAPTSKLCTDKKANNMGSSLPCTYNRGSGSHVSSGSILKPGQVLGAVTSCGIYVDKFLKKGLKGNDPAAVGKIQSFLNDYTSSGLNVDGKFGPMTDAALKAFQLAHADKILTPWGLTKPTGIFYLTTQTAVNNIMCPTLDLPIPVLTPMAQNPLFPKF